MTTTSININHPHRAPQSINIIPLIQSINNLRCMNAFRELALYLAHCADAQFNAITKYPQLRCAFLDDDSDYIPAATDMMTALTSALTADYTELECDILLARIATDRPFCISPLYTHDNNSASNLMIRIFDLPLDAATSLPIPDDDFDY